MAHAIHRTLLPVIALSLVVRSSTAAPNALVISETPLCRVSLSKLSYDGPDADDEEFVELVVERFATDSGVTPASGDAQPPTPACNTPHADAAIGATDAIAPSDARIDVPSGKLTLGDCGLGDVRLVNGGAGACDEYRLIPLGPVVVPADGFVLLCAQDSLFSANCDVDTAGRSAIRNGFLQNGPADGLRFFDLSGVLTLEVAYEGSPACFSPGAYRMADETGEASGFPGVDDVNVACSGRFELRPAMEASLRAPSRCEPPPVGGSGDAAPPPQATPADPGSSAPRPEFAPDVGVGYRNFAIPDASFTLPRASKGAPLEPPACRASRGRSTNGPSWPLGVAATLEALRRRRLRRLRGAPRAGCSARSETLLRRSP